MSWQSLDEVHFEVLGLQVDAVVRVGGQREAAHLVEDLSGLEVWLAGQLDKFAPALSSRLFEGA